MKLNQTAAGAFALSQSQEHQPNHEAMKTTNRNLTAVEPGTLAKRPCRVLWPVQRSTHVFSPSLEMNLLLVIALGLFTSGSAARAQTNPAPQNWVVRESAFGQTQPQTERIAVAFSQDARHVAIARTKEHVVTIQKDGKNLLSSGELQHMVLSPNGSRLAFSVKTGAGDKLVLDGRESVGYRRVLTNSFTFSADSRRFGYSSSDGGNDVANAMAFSPDNQRFAYSHQRGGRWSLWVDGQEGEALDAFGKAYYAVSSLVFDTAANLHFIGERHLETNKHEFVLVEAGLAGREGDRAASQ